MERFGLSELQAQAILDLRLRALTGLERKRVEDEYADLQERISELRVLLGDESNIAALIKEELLELKEIYGRSDERRTEIVAGDTDLELEDMIAEEDMVIAITKSGYIKRLPVTTYREQRRGGIGVMGMDTKDEDYIEHLFVASTHDYILFFTTVGKVYRLKVHELPLGSRSRRAGDREPAPVPAGRRRAGRHRDAQLRGGEVPRLRDEEGHGQEDEFAAYNTPLKADGIIAIKLRDDDSSSACGSPRGRRRAHGLATGAGGPSTASRCARWAATPRGRGDEAPRGRRGDRGRHRRRRGGPRRHAERLRQADAGGRLPRQRSRDDGRETVQLVEGKGRLARARIVRDGYQVMLISDGGTVIRIPVDGSAGQAVRRRVSS